MLTLHRQCEFSLLIIYGGEWEGSRTCQSFCLSRLCKLGLGPDQDMLFVSFLSGVWALGLLFSCCHIASCHFLFHSQFTPVLWNFWAMRNECMHFAAVWLRWKNSLLRAWIANKKDFSAESFELQSSVSHSECRNIIQLNLATSTCVGKWIIFLLSCTRENGGPTIFFFFFFWTGRTSKGYRKLDYRFLDSLISWLIC